MIEQYKANYSGYFEYPWDHNNKILINEVSGLHRLVQADAIGLRLEQVNKLI